MIKQVYRKDVDLKLARELVLAAIHAEWDKDFKTAALKWGQAVYVCPTKREEFCGNRRDLCQNLASREDLELVKKVDRIFEALKF